MLPNHATDPIAKFLRHWRFVAFGPRSIVGFLVWFAPGSDQPDARQGSHNSPVRRLEDRSMSPRITRQASLSTHRLRGLSLWRACSCAGSTSLRCSLSSYTEASRLQRLEVPYRLTVSTSEHSHVTTSNSTSSDLLDVPLLAGEQSRTLCLAGGVQIRIVGTHQEHSVDQLNPVIGIGMKREREADFAGSNHSKSARSSWTRTMKGSATRMLQPCRAATALIIAS